MAIVTEDEYPGRSEGATANYPQGRSINKTTPGTGTPLEEKWRNDIEGFLQYLLKKGNVIPSGLPDTAVASDYYDALIASLGTMAVVDAQTSSDDATAGRGLLTGAGGLLGDTSPTVTDTNVITVGGMYNIHDLGLNLPPILASYIILHEPGVSDQFATQTAKAYGSLIPTGVNYIFVRHMDNGLWEDWLELYSTGNLNPLEFGSSDGTGNKAVADGVYISSANAIFYFPVSLLSLPASITVTGTWSIYDNATGATIATGIPFTSFTMSSFSSNKLVRVQVQSGTTALLPSGLYELRQDNDTSAKLKVNP
jgi:hypothetical protein